MKKMTNAKPIKAEKNIPLPRSRKSALYPWREMKVGDSFLAPVPQRAFTAQASLASMRTGWKFVTRAVSKTSTRVWRVT